MLVYILSALIIVGGLILLLAVPVAGIVFVVLGICLIVWQSKKAKAKKAKANNETVRCSYRIAGISYHEADLTEIATESEEYGYSKKKLEADGLEGEKVYKYSLPTFARLEKDGNNDHDPSAVKVVVGGSHVGFIPAKNAVEVRQLMDSHDLRVSAYIEGGPYKMLEDDEITKGEDLYSGDVVLEYTKEREGGEK